MKTNQTAVRYAIVCTQNEIAECSAGHIDETTSEEEDILTQFVLQPRANDENDATRRVTMW